MNTPNSPAPAGRDSNTLVTVSEVAEQVGREILESQMEPGAWATALYECEGKREEALALYTRLRIRRLSKQRRVRLAKVRSFESRRLLNCMGDQATRESLAKTIQEMLGHAKSRGRSMNFMKPKLSVVWLSVLFFGTAGTVASLGRLFGPFLPDAIAHTPVLVAMLAGVGSVWSAIVVRQFLPKRWIMLGWNTGLVLSCNVLCLSSLLLGTKVIREACASETAHNPNERVPVRVNTVSVKSREAGPYLVSTTTTTHPGKN